MKATQLNKQNIHRFVLAGWLILSLLLLATPALATPPSGLTSEPVASGVLADAVRVKFKEGMGGFGMARR